MESKAKIVLLFGAGASKGCGGVNKTPPLGSELFSCLCKEYPDTWGSLITGRLEKEFRVGFEVGMESLYNNPGDLDADIVLLLKDMSIYFSKFKIINEYNSYFKLIKKFKIAFENRDIIISTLNYECLIEYALMLSKINDFYYLAGDSLKACILKIHGSCNFIPQNFHARKGSRVILGKSKLDAGIDFLHPSEVEGRVKNGFFAAMSLYEKNKTNIISPELIKEIANQYQKFVNEAEIVISIGVRPNPENDHHVWGPLASTDAKVYLIGSKDDCENWISKYTSSNGEYIGERFESRESFEKISRLIKDCLKET